MSVAYFRLMRKIRGQRVELLSDRNSHNKLLCDPTVTPLLFPISAYKISFPGSSVVKKLPAKCRRCGFDSWVRKIPWRRKWQPTPVFLPGKSHSQRSLAVLGVLTVRHNLVTKPPPPHTMGDITRVTYSQGLLLQTGMQLGIHADDRQFQVHLLELSISFPYVSRKHLEMSARMT